MYILFSHFEEHYIIKRLMVILVDLPGRQYLCPLLINSYPAGAESDFKTFTTSIKPGQPIHPCSFKLSS